MAPTNKPIKFNSTNNTLLQNLHNKNCVSSNINNCVQCLSGTYGSSCRWNKQDKYCYDFNTIPNNNGSYLLIQCRIIYISIGTVMSAFVVMCLCIGLFFFFNKTLKKQNSLPSISKSSETNKIIHKPITKCVNSDVNVFYDAYNETTPINGYEPSLTNVIEMNQVTLPKRHHSLNYKNIMENDDDTSSDYTNDGKDALLEFVQSQQPIKL
eukprot:402137_1